MRILSVDDPATAGYLHWTIQHLPATRVDTFHGSTDGIHIEIEVPAGHRDMGSLRHHAAVAHLFVLALIEDAIDTHLAHIHIADLRPAEELVVESKSGFEIGGVEFMPPDCSGRGRGGSLGSRH